jgi:two-component system, NtrC family, response regulator AtoC
VNRKILVIEDDRELNQALVQRLEAQGHVVGGVHTLADARRAVADGWDLALLDLRLPDGDGLSLLEEWRERAGAPLTLVMTASTAVGDAVRAFKLGAHDFLGKPFDHDELLLRIRDALSTLGRRGRPASREERRRFQGVASIIGESRAIRETRELVRLIAASDAATVLLTGESGTGKDLIARAIHDESARSDAPFMTITCTTISDGLLESELFGHERGSFTDAKARKDGLLELGQGGSVFLDEVGDLPLPLQGKLLRFLQEKTFKRVGGTRDIKVDVRVIAATHQPLRALVAEGRFRQDLYYRLKVIDGAVPPLRARLQDVPLLARDFVHRLNRALGRDVRRIDEDAARAMLRYPWPGNVRELKNALERAMVLGRGDAITLDGLPAEIREWVEPPGGGPRERVVRVGPGFDLEALERELIVEALRASAGDEGAAGQLLGLSPEQLRTRVERHRLEGL